MASPVLVHETLLPSDGLLGARSLYWIGGEFAGDHLHARILEAKERLLRRWRGEAVIAVGTDTPAHERRRARLLQQHFFNHVDIRDHFNLVGPSPAT
jgi:hypothetical protein